MNAVSPALFQKLVGKKLGAEVHHVLGVSALGFDVCVHTDDLALLGAFKALLASTLQEELRSVHLVHTAEELSIIRSSELDSRTFSPIVLVSSERTAQGAGLVEHRLPGLADLLPSCSAAIREVLDHRGLAIFQPIYTSERVRAFKTLLGRGQLSGFIDAVVQTAYLEGVRGESELAAAYLRKVSTASGTDPSAASESEALGRSLQWILAREHSPHQYAKALLSYFAVQVKDLSHIQASQVLGISRTTLQLHLQLAEKLGVPDVFGHARLRIQQGCDPTHIPV